MNQCSECAFSHNSWKKMGQYSSKNDFVVALAGNPNTGKSTIFNALTGLRQHTGNWPGKTVTRAEGSYVFHQKKYKTIDLPGTYSLLSTSEDEQIARDFILFEKPDVTLIVADATRLQRNLNLVLQILEITPKAVLCVNLLDEALRHHIQIDMRLLSKKLGIPVVGTQARSQKGFHLLLDTIEKVATNQIQCQPKTIKYLDEKTEHSISILEKKLKQSFPQLTATRWVALRLLQSDESIITALKNTSINNASESIIKHSEQLKQHIGKALHEQLSNAIYKRSEDISKAVISNTENSFSKSIDTRIDEIVTSPKWGFPIMFLLLGVVLWITIVGANYPSELLSWVLVEYLHPALKHYFSGILPSAINGFLFDGVYLAVAWVVAVMLPPMAIFFPLFTLLEDFGYLPRVAFNLDYWFKKSGSHGKQALTMAMGFGCNAAGVVSTRIIDSPRERLIAIITNNFSLCNGRWPTQILIASIFLGALVPAYLSGFVSILAVVGICILGIAFMFLSSLLLSKTLLKGESSTFHLELPPYRIPQFWQTIYTSIIDRTLIVLWRAVVFSAPAGAVIYLICNVYIGNQTIAVHLIEMLNPIGVVLGLNGIIILAYIIAIPANEIVIPTILMLTMLSKGVGHTQGVLVEIDNPSEVAQILIGSGWTTLTAINLMLFSLLHNPCSTTLFTIYKETKSLKWTTVAGVLPLIFGVAVTLTTTFLWYLFQK